jgi:uncharacterized protein (TIGR03437 family)
MRLGSFAGIVLFLSGATAVAQQSSCWPVPFATGYIAQTAIIGGNNSIGALVHESDGSISKEAYQSFTPYKRSDPVANAESLLWTCGQLPARPIGTNKPPEYSAILGTEKGVGGREALAFSLPDGRTVLLGIYDRAGVNQLVTAISKPDRSFDRQVGYPVALNPSRIMLGDFNEDGNRDVAVVSYGDYRSAGSFVSILLGKGDGTFGDAVQLPAGAEATTGAVGDLNGDGHADIAVLNSGSSQTSTPTVRLLFGNGDGTFRALTGASGPRYPTAVAIADVNGDGKPDLIVGGTGISYLPGNGDGTFRAPITVSSAGRALYVAVGDFNEDGRPDIASSDGDKLQLFVATADGNWRWSASAAAGYSPWEIIVTDFDLDGHLDLVAGTVDANAIAHIANETHVVVAFGKGDGTFEGAPSYPLPAGPARIATADVNGDGIPDLITANGSGGGLSLLLGKGGATFEPPRQLTPSSGSASLPGIRDVAAADLNKDGKVDLVVTNSSVPAVQVLQGRGDGTFGTPVSLAMTNNPLAVALGDFNGDGLLDIAATGEAAGSSGSPALAIFLANPGGGFRAGTTTVVGTSVGQLIAADINADGKFDLLLADAGTYGANGPEKGGVLVLTGKGDGTFNAPVTLAAGYQVKSILLTDLNGDGVPDLLAAGSKPNYSNALAYLQGSAGGAFAAPVDIRTDFGPNSVAAGDFSGDGLIDLVVAHCCGDTQLGLYIGKGDGSFEPESLDSMLSSPVQVLAQDLDGDGRLDIVVGTNPNADKGTLTIFRNVRPQVGTLTLWNGASLTQAKPAPGMNAIIRANGVTHESLVADGGPVETLGGITVTVTDSAGNSAAAKIFSLAPNEVSILTPDSLELGPATILVQSAGGDTWQAETEFMRVSPGLLTVSSDGLVRGYFESIAADGSSTVGELVTQDPDTGAMLPLPLDLGPEDQTNFIVLYGTGFRGASSVEAARATIGGEPAQVVEIVGNPDFPGLDQVRIRVPHSLAGKGLSDIVFSPEGVAANTVRLSIK